MHHPLRRAFALIVGLLALFAGSVAPDLAQNSTPISAGSNPFAALGLPEIHVTITATAFEGVPAEIPAGRYLLSVTNALAAGDGPFGAEPSGVNFLRLSGDMTADAFIAQIAAYAAAGAEADAMPPQWLYEVTLPGGPYALPGETVSAVIDLRAGAWVLWGEHPGAAQAPVSVSVTGSAPAHLPVVQADVQISMVEYAFVVPTPLAAGPQIVELTNAGQEPHFFTLARVPHGTTVEAGLAAFFARYGDPAAAPAGGLRPEELTLAFVRGTQSAGVTAWYTADLAPGTYLAVCFIPDPVNGIPHVMLGMTQIVEVA